VKKQRGRTLASIIVTFVTKQVSLKFLLPVKEFCKRSVEYGMYFIVQRAKIATYAAPTPFMSEFHISTEQPQSSGHVAGLYSRNIQLET
jgi:hypothetical protein